MGGGQPPGGPTRAIQTYVFDELAACLREHGVLHLRSLPHTPKHNPWAERGIGELKRDAGLGLRTELVPRLPNPGRRRSGGRVTSQQLVSLLPRTPSSTGAPPPDRRAALELRKAPLRAAPPICKSHQPT